MCCAASQSRTSAPIWLAKSDGSNCVIRWMPPRPASRLDQNVSTSCPMDVTTPSPVMTTQREGGEGFMVRGKERPISENKKALCQKFPQRKQAERQKFNRAVT